MGDVTALGNTYALRIWMKPDVMAQYGLEPSDVFAAIGGQSFVTSTGSLGEQSENKYQYSMEYKGTLKSIEEFNDIVLRTSDGGYLLHLSDVAEVEEKVKEIPEMESFATACGYGLISGNGSNYATLVVRLKHWDERPGMNHLIDLVIGRLYFACKDIKNVQVLPFQLPAVYLLTWSVQTERSFGALQTIVRLPSKLISPDLFHSASLRVSESRMKFTSIMPSESRLEVRIRAKLQQRKGPFLCLKTSSFLTSKLQRKGGVCKEKGGCQRNCQRMGYSLTNASKKNSGFLGYHVVFSKLVVVYGGLPVGEFAFRCPC